MSVKIIKNSIEMPMMAMRDLVLYPKMVIHFDVIRPKSINALRAALNEDRKIFLVTQKEVNVENPKDTDLYKVGVVAEIRQIVKVNGDITRVLVEGIYKAKLTGINAENEEYLKGTVAKIPKSLKYKCTENEMEAICRTLKESFEKYATVMPRMPKELYLNVLNESDPFKLFDAIITNISLLTEDKQYLLERNDIAEILLTLNDVILKEFEVLSIAKQIQQQTSENAEKNQRDYFLREQMKVIKEQLGEDDDLFSLGENDYFEAISKLKIADEHKDKLFKEAVRLSKLPEQASEAGVVRNYLDTCLELPWDKMSKEKNDIIKARAILDKEHYGLSKVKDRIIEILSVKALAPDVKGQIVCLVGPPGVGKTSIGKSIAHATGRKYVRVSLGGIKDESDIRGHRKTYIGSMPGRIIDAIRQAGTKNPVILLDEIDKMSNDFRGDPASAMLEVLDSEQNFAFRDHYIELPFDLSNVLFITTANNISTISPPLLDRMDVIELTSYTREEKFNIAKNHLASKQIKKNGMNARMIRFDDSSLYELIDNYTREAGVRTLERRISSICRKVAKDIVSKKEKRVFLNAEKVREYLGARRYSKDFFAKTEQVGVTNGLAWTSVGGTIMPLEVLALDGKGNLEITGSLGDVMKESAKIAVSYCRSVADKYEINKDFYEKKDIHIHAPEGAVPKDGPSAGVTLVTSLISALSNIKVRSDIAMTGEITLHGKVLPIGGLKEKTMAAYKEGIKTVIIPYDNKPDVEEIDDIVKASLNFYYAKTLDEVLEIALVKEEKTKKEIFKAQTTTKEKKIDKTLHS